MKYRPNYPRIVESLEAAREYLTDYVHWYSTDHKHSGIALFSPAQVHDGSWKELWNQRDKTHQEYYETHQEYYEQNPGRFRQRPTTPAPAQHVGINLPKPEEPQKTA